MINCFPEMSTKPTVFRVPMPHIPDKPCKTKTGTTYVAFVLDSSGSMAYVRDITISGFNEQVQTIRKKSQELNQDVKVSLVTFNTETYFKFFNAPADKLQELNREDYAPGGGTALYDALGATIDTLMRTTDLTDEDAAWLVVVFTDGAENASRQYSSDDIALRIKKLQDTKQWTFTYIGANHDLSDVQKTFNLSAGNMMNYKNDLKGTMQSLQLMCGSTASYLNKRSLGETQVADYLNTEDKILDIANESTSTESTK